MEDEIDLRKYTDVLRKHWKLIVIIIVIAAFVAGLVSFLSPPTYEASAGVLMTKARSEIVFEPKYRTSLEADTASQQQALKALLKSGTVANLVIEELGDKLDPGERGVASMLGRVEVNIQGDLIEISVKSTDPHKAAAIANAWAESYESYINDLYSGIRQSPEDLQIQAAAAQQEYEENQKTLEDFTSDNHISELERQIADKELLCNVKSLREQIEEGSSSPASAAANSLAIILLQTDAFTSLPAELQISLESLSDLSANPEKQLHDIDALISLLETRSGGAREQSIAELRQEILQLKGELEKENAEKQNLERSRDIAWETCTTLENKLAEVRVAMQTQEPVVRVAILATVPDRPVTPRKAMNIGIALVLGLVIGILCAFGAEYFKRPREKIKDKENE